MKIVFLGTPDFAVSTLDALLQSGHDVVGVITSPDRMGGRGMKQVIESDVKKYAVAHNLNIMQPTNLKSPKFVEELRSLNADIQFVVAFRMLPEIVWNMPRLGTYNLHGSLLPKYRGAAPINWAIMNGDEYTGVTTFKLKHKIDTGSIAYQERVDIARTDDFATVYNRMKVVGADLVLKTLDAIKENRLELQEQTESEVTEAPKIYHRDCALDYSRSVRDLYHYVRGLSPYPTAWTTFNDKKLKIYQTKYSYERHTYQPGTYVSDGKKWLKLYVSDGFLDLTEIQAEGRKRMDVKTFLNGFNIKSSSLPFVLL